MDQTLCYILISNIMRLTGKLVIYIKLHWKALQNLKIHARHRSMLASAIGMKQIFNSRVKLEKKKSNV